MAMRGWLPLALLLGLAAPFFARAATGTILTGHQYAWSDQVGYINFQGITVTDTALTGYAWSTNSAFINFNPTRAGVFNNGNGTLSGSAWGEDLGYIDFSHVSIDANGRFAGTATGTDIGTLTFDCPTYCDVETDWRPTVVVHNGGGGGGGGGGGSFPCPTGTTGTYPNCVTAPAAPPEPVSPKFGEFGTKPGDLTPSRADPYPDGHIDALDFNVLMVHWGERAGDASKTCGDKILADVNCDGVVDILDFNLLMVYWGKFVTGRL